MTTVDGDQAIAWMRAKGTNVPGSCLNTCWQAYGSHPSIGAHAGQYPDAIDGWDYATKRHPGDMNPPAGYPVWFGVSPTRTDSDAGAGDVVISLGGGQVIATDANGIGGRIGVTSIAARAARIQRPYLGWTEDFLGYDVVATSTASLSSNPLEDDMPLTPADASLLLNFAAYDGGASVSQVLKDLELRVATIAAIVAQPVIRNGKVVPRIQDEADTGTVARDIDTVAHQIAAQIGSLQASLGALAAGQGADPAAIQAAAEAGAARALANLKLEAVPAAPAS